VSRIVVTGSSSGLGRHLMKALLSYGHNVFPYDKSKGFDVLKPHLPQVFLGDGVDVLINCAGVAFLNWFPKLSEHDWDMSMDVNAKGIFMMSRHLIPELKEAKGTIVNIVSSAANMPMRTSHAYCASKAAALMLTRTMARELAPDITVFSVSPNRMKGTMMSEIVDQYTEELRGWSAEEVQQKQLAASLIGEETPPELVAEFIAYLLSKKERHKYLTGCDIQYGV
jgi:meso-butanediol dehydrogenase/(S,S)-butanediol dehydrogenase/diacetyl reductase